MNPWLILLICGGIAFLLSILVLRPVEKAEKKYSDFGNIMKLRCDQIYIDSTRIAEKAYWKYKHEAKEKSENPHLYWTVKQIDIKTGRIECHVSYPTLKEAQDKGAEWLKPYPGIPQDHYVAIFSDNRIHQAAGNKLISLESFGAETMKAIRGNS
jgi:hypothetical protein